MELIRSTINNVTFNSFEFSSLPAESIERLRYSLVCIHCDTPGFYRKESRDGKKACFGAHHRIDCPEHEFHLSSYKKRSVVKVVNKILASNHIVNLKFNNWGLRSELVDDSIKNKASRKSTGVSHQLGPATQKITNLKLISVLKCLIHSPSFSSSDVLIRTGSLHPFKAKNLFLNFRNADLLQLHSHNKKQWKGFWGTIDSISDKWMKCGDILIPVEHLNKDVLLTWLNKVNYKHEKLAGWHFLIFDFLNLSKTGKSIIQPTTNTPFVFLKP